MTIRQNQFFDRLREHTATGRVHFPTNPAPVLRSVATGSGTMCSSLGREHVPNTGSRTKALPTLDQYDKWS